MHAKARPSFAFLVLTYNHQDYILEHLESIKYLVKTYGADLEVDLIINDDCSKDQTCRLVESWLKTNDHLFRQIKTLFNSKNLGTCASVNNMLAHLIADRCKLTAGDDVYSFENIFELTKHDKDVAMVSGRALYLMGESLGVDRLSNTLVTATQVIYQNNSLLHRFKHFSISNAPNMLYAAECLLHAKVRAHLLRFDVTEDWPLQVAIARQFPRHRFELIDKVLVYYRRTPGSTYIVANQRFIKDKILMYDDLLEHEGSWLEQMRLAARKFCFKTQNRWVNKLLNLDMYFFCLAFATRVVSIVKREIALNMCVSDHQFHYERIKVSAEKVRMHLA